MNNLTYKSVSVMKKTREASSSQITIEEKTNLVACLASLGCTHVEITMFTPSNASLVAHGFTPSPRTIEAETQQWYDVIHAQPNVYGAGVFGGYLKVYDRAVFPEAGDNNGSIAGYSIETSTPVGTAASAEADGNSTWCGRYRNYLYNSVTLAKIETGDIQCPFAEITARAFSGSFFSTQGGAHTFTYQCHLLCNTFASAAGKTVVFLNNPNFSETTSGWWSGHTDTGIVCYDYYGDNRGNATVKPSDYYYDHNQTYLGISLAGYGISTGGLPQFNGEWGDLSGSISIKGTRSADNFVTGTTNLEEWVHYIWQYFKVIKTLVDENKIDGWNWWGGWESQNTSILYKTGSGTSSQYFPNWRGQMLANFYRGNGMTRRPVITTGTYSEAQPNFGGRAMYF